MSVPAFLVRKIAAAVKSTAICADWASVNPFNTPDVTALANTSPVP